jgi:DNA-binding PadR family transcriptional regulator
LDIEYGYTLDEGGPVTTATAYIYVLTALGGGPRHGLGIAENVAAFTDGQTILGPGTLYRCLRELAEDGLIERADPPEGDDHPHRKYYRLTAAGRDRLTRDVHELDRLVRAAQTRLGGLRPAEAT